jgi:porin
MANLLKCLKTALPGGLLIGLLAGSAMAASSPPQDNPALQTTTEKESSAQADAAITPKTTATQGKEQAKANEKGKKNDETQHPFLLERDQISVPGNPGADNVLFGTGWLGRELGLTESSGVRLGGIWLGNADIQMSGRLPGSASFNSLGIVDVLIDMDKVANIEGGSFAATFLQFDGQPSNTRAGVMTGYNGITEQAPLNRSELYELWWRQLLFDNKLSIRAGKSVPTFDFNNVSRRLPIPDEKPYVAAVSGLLFTPIFVNPSILGVMPGYYNSAWGLTLSATPSDNTYLTYGLYDGSLGLNRQTGIHAGPIFDTYFTIGEAGISWGSDLPGRFALGGWGQGGDMGSVLPNASTGARLNQNGAQGIYTTASNRLMNVTHESGTGVLLGYFQYGINNSRTMIANQFVGGGLTGIGIVPFRPRDSAGLGFGVSWLNEPPSDQSTSTEILTQFYYQAHLIGDIYFQPTFSYVPNPGDHLAPGKTISGCTASCPSMTSMIFQIVALF